MAAKRGATKRTFERQREERRARFAEHTPKAVKRALGATTTAQTPLQVRAPGIDLDADDRAYVRERSSFKLGKFGLSITRIGVGFTDVSGPTGAPTIECRFKVLLLRAGELVVSAQGDSPRAAFDRAVASTERTVRRTLEKGTAARTRRVAR